MQNKAKRERPPGDGSNAVAYFRRAYEIVRPNLGPVLVSSAFLILTVSVFLKRVIPDGTWTSSIASAVMLTLGAGLGTLSTAMVVRDADRRK
jgi:hypothetical protein